MKHIWWWREIDNQMVSPQADGKFQVMPELFWIITNMYIINMTDVIIRFKPLLKCLVV